jgi:hypothetical protein
MVTSSVGDFTVNGAFGVQQIQEKIVPVVYSSSPTTINWNNGAIYRVTSLATNFTANITNLPTTADKAYVVTFILIQGGTPYFINALQIAGSSTTIRWPGGTVPTATANRHEIQAFTLVYTGSAWSAYGQLTSFG